MAGDLPPQSVPKPEFGGRTLMQVFAGAAAGNAADQITMSEISVQAGEAGVYTRDSALDMAGMWAKAAWLQGHPEARRQIVNVQLIRATMLRGTKPAEARDCLAEAVSFLDELAGEGYEEPASNLDFFLSRFVASGGSEDDRTEIVTTAKRLRRWRDEHGALA